MPAGAPPPAGWRDGRDRGAVYQARLVVLRSGSHSEYPAAIPVTGGITPLKFDHTFKVAPPAPKEGLYKLTATISHSPTADPTKLSEMFGFAESTPVDIRNTVVESD